jgi:hypothetical protein
MYSTGKTQNQCVKDDEEVREMLTVVIRVRHLSASCPASRICPPHAEHSDSSTASSSASCTQVALLACLSSVSLVLLSRRARPTVECISERLGHDNGSLPGLTLCQSSCSVSLPSTTDCASDRIRSTHCTSTSPKCIPFVLGARYMQPITKPSRRLEPTCQSAGCLHPQVRSIASSAPGLSIACQRLHRI